MIEQRLIQRVDELIEMGKTTLNTGKRNHYGGLSVDVASAKGFRSAALSFIQRVLGKECPHYAEFHRGTDGDDSEHIQVGLEILRVIRGEIEGGWLFKVVRLVTAEVFADFLDMADHLLASDYKDPAAVVIGSVLEEHLRQLCKRNDIPVARPKDGKEVPLKADQLNSDLTKAGVYVKLDQKYVTAWLDLRNKAAHGKYEEYNKEQVSVMMTGVRDFMTRVPV